MSAGKNRRIISGALILFTIAMSAACAATNEDLTGGNKMATTPLAGSQPDEMEKIFTEHPEKFSPAIIAAYRARRIVPGMDPYVASRAGGAFEYRVDADRKWPGNTDPLRIIYAQAMHPDDSKIWMTFSNGTQFPALGVVQFAVTVEHGVVTDIVQVAKKTVGH